MKIFLSHSHRAKALPLSVRSARTCPNIYRRGWTVRAPDSAHLLPYGITKTYVSPIQPKKRFSSNHC